MNKPRKHAELIKLWADGVEIEYYYMDKWYLACDDLDWNKYTEYRIKPEKEYPKSTLTDEELEKILRINRGLCESVTMARIVADAAIKRYIKENAE